MTPDKTSSEQLPQGIKLFKNWSLFRIVWVFLVSVFLSLLFYFYSHLILEIIFTQFLSGESIATFFPIILNAVFLFIGTWIFLEVTKFFISKYLENKGKKKEIKLIVTLYSYIVWALMLVLIAASLFKDIGLFVASLGLLGFGLTLALQKPILNFVGWLTIVINKPFNVGDRIEVSGHRGDVVAIHTMYSALQGTRLNSQEKSEKIITFPNEFILTYPVINYTKRVDLYWEDMNVTVTFDSNWRKAEKILFDITFAVVKKYVSLPAVSVQRDKKSFEDALKLLEDASKKLSKGFIKESLKENIETMKTIEQQSGATVPEPTIRVDILDSGIGLNVLFQVDIRRIRVMRGEIGRGFLSEISKHSDIKIAYPRMHIVYDGQNRFADANSKKVTDFV